MLIKKKNLKDFFQGIRPMVYAFFVFTLLSILGYAWPIVSNLIFCLIIAAAIYFSLIKIEYGFLFLIFEFLIGHEGHLFELGGISLRLALFLVVMSIWFIQKIIDKKQRRFFVQFVKSPILVMFLIFFFVIILGLFQGMITHEPILAIKDFINYSYLFLIFPLLDIFKKKGFIKNIFKMSQASIIGLSILTIIVFILFVTNLSQVHGQFYWWWRSVVVGKATDTSNGFFRIVSSAHLLILPLFLILLSFLIENKKKFKGKCKKYLIYLSIGASLMLLINFSRAYFLGILIGLIFLLKGINWRRWLIFSCLIIFLLIAEFGLLFGLVSGGEALQGLDFFKNRIGTIISPDQEISSLTRMTILPVLTKMIKQSLIFGSGLGATVEYTDLLTGQDKTTFHLDWGYLEIWVELGLFGLISYALVLLSVFYQGWQTIKKLKRQVFEKRLIIGLLAGLASLIVASLTGPFLFHPIGIFYLVLTTVIIISIKENEFKVDNTNCYLEQFKIFKRMS